MSKQIREPLGRLLTNVQQVIKGKNEVVKDALIGILARGHILLEDVPGVGKTTLAHLLARSINLSFSRIQFTSDMMPSDIIGVSIYDQREHQFEFKQGPVFANIVLADEINRTSPKTQSALLEAMNSAQVTMDKQTYNLPQPFMVIATQNPIEFHGTYPLPKSQMDRFLLRLSIGYPDLENEVSILRDQVDVGNIDFVQPVLSSEEMISMQHDTARVKIDDDLLHYLARIVAATRNHRLVDLGISTRGALALRRAAQARAYIENRDFVVPDDIKDMVVPVFAHRIQVMRSFETSAIDQTEEEQVLKQILSEVDVPL
ncbi:ATPase [candidate division BRC1 bacterium HGW-BRC1-1]|nr:MAG: ATPase [candidate division BRC1 bacterium HGW-BRC1-1]